MKKILSYFGAISLAIISFLLSEQTTLVVKETDEIMCDMDSPDSEFVAAVELDLI